MLAALSTDGACPGATSWQKSDLNFHQSGWDLGESAVRLPALQHCSCFVKTGLQSQNRCLTTGAGLFLFLYFVICIYGEEEITRVKLYSFHSWEVPAEERAHHVASQPAV